MPNKPIELHITSSQMGQRLDNVLAQIFPELSLRARRRLWDSWHIYVDKKPQGSGFRVQTGQVISLCKKNIQSKNENHPKPHIIKETNELIFMHKPCGLHSTKLEYGGTSLEDFLPDILPQYENAVLCNRLDAQTSGIVVIAKDEQAKITWQNLENTGHCQKLYVALVQGMPKDCIIDVALHTAKRKKSRVLESKAEPLRKTEFQILARVEVADYNNFLKYFPDFNMEMPENIFLMGCSIYKGARHQIRAHAAHAGFALYNDKRYAWHAHNDFENECFALHHGRLHLPDLDIYCNAPWEVGLSPALFTKIKSFMQGSLSKL